MAERMNAEFAPSCLGKVHVKVLSLAAFSISANDGDRKLSLPYALECQATDGIVSTAWSAPGVNNLEDSPDC
jgi:hypothetical protein